LPAAGCSLSHQLNSLLRKEKIFIFIEKPIDLSEGLLAMSTCFSLYKTSSLSLRGNMPGSVHAVRNKTEITNRNKKAPTSGTAIVSFSYKYGQLNKTNWFT
jgi:hypothetical protein